MGIIGVGYYSPCVHALYTYLGNQQHNDCGSRSCLRELSSGFPRKCLNGKGEGSSKRFPN